MHIAPLRHLIALPMEIVVMLTTQGNDEFVTDLATERIGLGKFEMGSAAGRSLSDQARLFSYIGEMRLVAPSDRFGHRGNRLVMGAI